MKVGLWNIEHPELGPGVTRKERRFGEVVRYLEHADCDVLILTEANAALKLTGYSAEFSEVSPFRSSKRYYGTPNLYHQVGMYSRSPLRRLEVSEAVNGLLCEVPWGDRPLQVYGNVITIKDRWMKDSEKTYKDRLREQLAAIESLPPNRVLVGGDFNLSLGWRQSLSAHAQVKSLVDRLPLVWPTELRDDTVQHVLHSPDLKARIEIDFSVKHVKGGERRLSDHPFLAITIEPSRETGPD